MIRDNIIAQCGSSIFISSKKGLKAIDYLFLPRKIWRKPHSSVKQNHTKMSVSNIGKSYGNMLEHDSAADRNLQIDKKLDSVTDRILQIDKKLDSVTDRIFQIDKKLDSVTDRILQIVRKLDSVTDRILQIDKKLDSATGRNLQIDKLFDSATGRIDRKLI
jgi:septal ring factor EnvC (AmiA/AmiB activator)